MELYFESLRNWDFDYFSKRMTEDLWLRVFADFSADPEMTLDSALWNHGAWPFIGLGPQGHMDALWHKRHNTPLSREWNINLPRIWFHTDDLWTLQELKEFERLAKKWESQHVETKSGGNQGLPEGSSRPFGEYLHRG